MGWRAGSEMRRSFRIARSIWRWRRGVDISEHLQFAICDCSTRRAGGGGGEGIPELAVGAFAGDAAGAGRKEDRVVVLQVAVESVALAIDCIVDGEVGKIFGIEPGGIKAKKSFW